jgi:HAMP domain-containing protein
VALRTRIAVTFLLLLAAVLAAALGAVSMTNRDNAEREVQRQLDVGASVFSRLLESNRRQLTQAAQAVAADYGFREAVATRDTDTLVSVLENSGGRIGAPMVVLTSLNGDVIAASGLRVKAGTPFPVSPLQTDGIADDRATSLIVDNGRIYQFVTVSVRSPLPVAWIAMGFELDTKAARELADITGLAVTLSVNAGGHWTDVVSTVPAGAARQSDIVSRRIEISKWGNAEVVAVLSRSLSDARAPFDRLTRVLFLIAAISLVASALAAFWLARNITRPLQDLTQAVDKIRSGVYDVHLNVHRRDELGVLGEGLQLMQTAV